MLLPNQWSLRPAGKQLELGVFPVNIALHPSGRWLAVLLALATIHGLYRSARFSRLMYLVDLEAWALARTALLAALLLSVALAGLTF